MLDTNIVSHAIKDPHGPVQQRIKAGSSDLAISVIVAAELRYGAERRRSARLTDRVTTLLRIVNVLPLPVGTDEQYGRMRAGLERIGKPIGLHDLLIAAHALALGATLVTDNVREFGRVEGLVVENWLRS